MLGVFVGSAALIIILSVFNGFEHVILSMYNTFTPEIRIEPAHGKTFEPAAKAFQHLKKDRRIENYAEVLQEKALLRYGEAQYIGLVKGVSEEFLKRKKIDSTIVQGKFDLGTDSIPYAVAGSTVQLFLTLNVGDPFRDLEVYSPRKGAQSSINPADEFTVKVIHPVGVFQIQQQFDESVIVPIQFARELLGEPTKVSSIEIYLKPGQSAEAFQNEISARLGKGFAVKNRVQQNELLYKILNSEKWAIFFILTFVLIIAVFNIIGSLTMLVIDKKKDIAILASLGAGEKLIQRIFFIEGMMISLLGCLTGLAAGLLFCILQQKFGMIKMAETNFVTDAYPIALKAPDFVLVFLTVTLISAIASAISSRLSIKTLSQIKTEL